MEKEKLEAIAEKVFGEGTDLVQTMVWIHRGQDKSYWQFWKDNLEKYKRRQRENPESKNAKEDRVDEEKNVALIKSAYTYYKSLLPVELERLRHHPFHRLLSNEKLFFLKALVDKTSFPLYLEPKYSSKSLSAGSVQNWGDFSRYGCVINWLEDKERWEHLPFSEEKIKKDSDLIQIATLFDFVPNPLSPRHVSHGIFYDETFNNFRERENALSHAKWNAYYESTRSDGDYRSGTWRETASFKVLYLVDFDKILGVNGLTDYTVRKAKKTFKENND
ncbi:MAG: hypothetical protein WCI72_03035 [archaeon]